MSGFSSTLDAASATLNAARPVMKTVTLAEPVVTHSADQDMMYAWSIGVTGAARNVEDGRKQSDQEKETCPPEVYIG